MDDICCLTATALKSSVAVRKATCRIPSEAVRKRSILFVRNIGEVYARRKWDKTHKHRLGNSSISMIFHILRNYLDERLMCCDRTGLTRDFDDVGEAFSDGCIFTVELAQKIVEEMFSSSGEAGESLARYFRNCLFENIKSKKILL